jgi:hypothetical protein
VRQSQLKDVIDGEAVIVDERRGMKGGGGREMRRDEERGREMGRERGRDWGTDDDDAWFPRQAPGCLGRLSYRTHYGRPLRLPGTWID